MKSLTKFDIDTFFQQDAKDIFSAREKGIGIHKTKNIDAAGDEIELPVKDVIKSRLPQQYYVGQGHIVDSDLNASGQFDITIADNKGSPILFSSANNTDYLTYESVFAVGEVKSTYYKGKNYIKDFCEKIKYVDDNLSRVLTPPDQISQDLRFSTDGIISISSSDPRPYKNPLYRFMFFVNSGDLVIQDLGTTLNQYNNKHCPNLICFLDKGIVLKAEALEQLLDKEITSSSTVLDAGTNKTITINRVLNKMGFKLGNVEFYPEFIPVGKEKDFKWVFYEFDKNTISASCLAYVIYALNKHIADCIVLKPDLLKYHNKLFKVTQAEVIAQSELGASEKGSR